MNRAYEIPTHRTLRDGIFGGGAVPGTSCQATISPSLRDFSHRPQLGFWITHRDSDPRQLTDFKLRK
jgi:hypothetical protein